MTGILTWLNEHIGLEGTILFAFIVMITSMTIKSITKVFELLFLKQDDWGKKAGELKDRVHSIQKEYHDFKNNLSQNQKRSPENKTRLQSLEGRLKFAKNKRAEHLASKNNKKSGFLFIILLLIISAILFVYIRYYTSFFQHYLAIISVN